jgi:hypothetical protein
MARGKDPQRKFKIFFVLLVLFCLIMALWLPREL